MNLLGYLRRHKESDDAPYAIGEMAGVFAFLILSIFSLSLIDQYLLRNTSLASIISAVLVDLANGDRAASNLGGLTMNPVLTAAAQAKADDMVARGYFSHISPDGKNSWYWFRQVGYSFTYAGENLAVDFSDSIDVERAWMNSPTHRSNILGEHFTEVGIATAQGFYDGHPTTFVVQMFGTPAAHGAPVKTIQTLASPAEPTTPALATTETSSPKKATTTAPTPTATTTLTSTPATSTAVALTPPSPAPTTVVLGTQADSILPPPASWWKHLIASPKSMLEYTYFALAGVILLLLAFTTELEFHRRHMRHVAAAAFLFVLMAGLFTMADLIFFAHPVIAAVLP